MIKINREINLKTFLAFAGVLLSLSDVYAQTNKFRYRADVFPVDSSGVYKIELQPGFVAKSAEKKLSDIRLIDEQGKFIAYSVINDSLEKSAPVFVSFPEIKHVSVDTSTIYISDAGAAKSISSLWLTLKNTEVTRIGNLSGSDDLKHWFAIKEGIELQSAVSRNSTEYEQMLSFPISNYRYFRIQINNKNRDPVKIVRSGIYVCYDKTQQIKLVPLPAGKLSIKAGNKLTNYLVELDDKYLVDALKINVAAPRYYEREAIVYDARNVRRDTVYPDILSSSRKSFVYISAKTDRIGIEIRNGDDNPLTIKEVIPIQLQRSVAAYLEKGHKYHLLTGDTSAREVRYDLTFLHSKPVSRFPAINHSAVYKNPAFGKLVFKVSKDYTQLIWISIAVVLILLSLLTWRMVKELSAKNNDNADSL